MNAQPHHLRRGSQRAFTLLELIVAMAIVVILSASLYVTLRTAFKAKAGAEASLDAPRTAEIALSLLGQDLCGSVAPNTNFVTTFTGTDGTDDRGRDGDDVVFYSVADAPLHAAANGEIKNVELAVMTGPNGDHVLVRKVVRNLLAQQTVNPDVEVICRGVGGFNLRYYDGSSWANTWDSTQQDNTLPAAVEVTLTLDRPGGPVTNRDGTQSFRYTRIFPLACSTAAQDSAVNTGL